MAIIGRNM